MLCDEAKRAIDSERDPRKNQEPSKNQNAIVMGVEIGGAGRPVPSAVLMLHTEMIQSVLYMRTASNWDIYLSLSLSLSLFLSMLCAVPQRRVLDAEAGTVVWPQRCVDVGLSELAPVLRGMRVVESHNAEGLLTWRTTWDESDTEPGLSLLYELPNLAITDDLLHPPREDKPKADAVSEQVIVAFGEFPRGEVSAASYPMDLLLDLQLSAGLGPGETARLVAAHALMGRTTTREVARVTCLATAAHVRRWTSFLSVFASPTAVCLVLTGVRDAEHTEELLRAAAREDRGSESYRTWLRLRVSVVLCTFDDAPRLSAAQLQAWVDRYGLAGLGVTHCADPCMCAQPRVGGPATCCVSGHCK
jgi:hypothetical protein